MKPIFGLVLVLLLAGCGESTHAPLWREQRLPSGQIVKITAFHLAWGIDHEARLPKQDALNLEYVANTAGAEPAVREREARDVFELIRPTAELWNFSSAAIAGFPRAERRGRYDLFVFTRGADGAWACERRDAKVFIND